MSNQTTAITHRAARCNRLLITGLFLALTINFACKSESSVVSSGEPAASNSATTTPQPATSAPPVTAPPLPSASPVGPTGQITPATAAQSGQAQPGQTPKGKSEDTGNTVSEGVITRTAAKPAPTQAADPFPPRPTPTVVMQNGKIVQQWPAPTDVASKTNPHASEPNAAALGREFYMQKCVDCHGKAGQGNGWLSPSLKRDGKLTPPTNLASRMVQANTDGELFWKITNGRSPMPAHRVRFDDDQRWYIVSFLRTLK